MKSSLALVVALTACSGGQTLTDVKMPTPTVLPSHDSANALSIWPQNVLYPAQGQRLPACSKDQPQAYVHRFAAPLRNARDPYRFGIETDFQGCMFMHGRRLSQLHDASVLFSESEATRFLTVFTCIPGPLGFAIRGDDRFPLVAVDFYGHGYPARGCGVFASDGIDTVNLSRSLKRFQY
jgi:hypothetical protein